ncbi:phosphodiester glycosidase family protein [Labilibaculum euxinus]
MRKNRDIALSIYKKLHNPRLFLLVLSTFFVVNTFASDPDATMVEKVVNGVEYSKITLKNGPVVIHQLRIDMSCENLEFSGSVANNYLGFGLEKTSQMVARENRKENKVIAAVNADFFGGKRPVFQNCMILDGEFVKGVKMSRTLFMADEQGFIHLDNYQFNGICMVNNDTLVLDGLNIPVEKHKCSFYNKFYRKMPVQNDSVVYWRLMPLKKPIIGSFCSYQVGKCFVNPDSLNFVLGWNYLGLGCSGKRIIRENDTIDIRLSISPEGVAPHFMIGGLPRLIQNGKRIVKFKNREGLSRKGFWNDRHPRTAVGIDHKNNYLYMIVVDGRQPDYSIGMKLKELGKYLKKLGCDEALNFDGGGSSAMIVNELLMNHPSDKNGERNVSNIFLIRER